MGTGLPANRASAQAFLHAKIRQQAGSYKENKNQSARSSLGLKKRVHTRQAWHGDPAENAPFLDHAQLASYITNPRVINPKPAHDGRLIQLRPPPLDFC